MTISANFTAHAVLFHTRQFLRNLYFVQLLVSTPLVFVAIKALSAWGADRTVGNSVWFESGAAGMWAMTTMASGMIGYQRFQGTLVYLALSPRGPGHSLGTLVATTSFTGLLCFPVGMGSALLVGGGVSSASPIGVIGSSILLVVACCCAAGAISVLFVLSRHAIIYEVLLVVPVWMVSGIIVSYEDLPQFLRTFGLVSPLTGAVAGARASISGASMPYGWLLLSALTSLAWLLIARWGMSRALDRATRAGSLALT